MAVAMKLPGFPLVRDRIDDAEAAKEFEMVNLIWTVVVVLFALWLVGLVMHIGGGLIHLLLVIAAVLLVYNLITKGKATI